MHAYVTDSSERKFIPLYIACVSVLLTLGLNRVFNLAQFTMPWWVDAPSVMGFYGLLYTLFDKYLWKMQILRTIGFIRVPNLNGTWNGYITSSFDEHIVEHDATIRIFQDWTQIAVVLKTKYSESTSLTATIVTEDPNIILSYEYLNEPKPDAECTMHAHRGTARLSLKSGGKVLEGEYYTGRDRRNFGILRFEKDDYDSTNKA